MPNMLAKALNVVIDRAVLSLLQSIQSSNKQPLLVGAEKYGRIGNRLYLGAHLVAWARQTGALLLYPGFYDYEHLFEATCRDAYCRFPETQTPLRLSPGFKRLLFQAVSRLSLRVLANPIEGFQTINLQPDVPDIGAKDFLSGLISRPVTFIRGFVYDNQQSYISDEIKTIRHHFRPREDFVPGIKDPIQRLREQADIVLGVVIRHGDFKTWRGGEFYFRTQDYIALMDCAVEYLAPRKVGFFIASDEDQSREQFQHHLNFFRAGHAIENLGSLALCDGMLAAESSFTGWSQYYGAVPTFHISRDFDFEKLKHVLDATVLKLPANQPVGDLKS